MPLARRKEYQNTTVRLPKAVYQRAKTAVEKSEAASSFNEFVVNAIEEKLHGLSEAEIDSAFAGMANDIDYQREAVALTQQFEPSDWEALQFSGVAHESTPIKKRASKSRSR